MSRSLKKGPYVDRKLLDKIRKLDKSGEKKPIKTWSRRSTVTPEFVGRTFLIHNGMRFISAFITEDMVGHKLGEFSPTRTFRRHGTRAEKPTAKTYRPVTG